MADTNQPQEARILWQIRLDAPIGRHPLPLADGVLVPLKRGDRSSVRRIAVESGEALWETTLDGPAAAQIARSGQTVFVPLTAGRLTALDLADGAVRTPAFEPVSGELADPVCARKGRVYLRVMPGDTPQLTAFEVGRPAALWSLDDPTDGARDARFQTSAGTLVIGGTSGESQVTVAGVDTDWGDVKWTNKDGEGRLNDLWAVAGLVDLVTDVDGILGIDTATGRTRNQRFSNFPFQRALTVGECLVMVTEAKGDRVIFCFNSVGENITGKMREPIERVIAASATEVLASREDGTPALFALPDLEPIYLPEVDQLGPILTAHFARDVAYLVSEDRHTLTALDLDARG